MKLSKWYAPLTGLVSKGSQTDAIGGHAGLHEARRIHQGQFFTPLSIVEMMWRVADIDVFNRNRRSRITLLDNSFGSGRMFAFADPDYHDLYGIEADVDLAQKVIANTQKAKFNEGLVVGESQEMLLRGKADVALINPPFSITWDTPYIEKYGFNSYGRYGAKSLATSHRYLLAQAMDASRYTVALLPRSFVDEMKHMPHFDGPAAIYHLPTDSFKDEGANVEVSVVIWEPNFKGEKPFIQTLEKLEDAERVIKYEDSWSRSVEIVPVEREISQPAVTMPVTHNRNVRICHSGRKIVFKFECAIAQARTLNHIFKSQLHARNSGTHRMPKGLQWDGQGKLDLQAYLIQPDPLDALKSMADSIRGLGFDVTVDPGLVRHMQRRVRQNKILLTPFRHWVVNVDGGLKRWLNDQRVAGNKITVTTSKAIDVRWDVEIPPKTKLVLGADKLNDETGEYEWTTTWQQRWVRLKETDVIASKIHGFKPLQNGWTLAHPGLIESHPTEYKQLRDLAISLGLNKWCSWAYQFDDLIEIGLKKGNCIVGWDMGLGKSRCMLALCVLGRGFHNLISVEAHLVKEMVTEIKRLGIPVDQWQRIDDKNHVRKLRLINIITYNRLKASYSGNTTYAHKLRRRIHTHVSDEGQLLRNTKTLQSVAVATVCAKRNYIMTGTPISNYPRDVLALNCHVAGDGTVVQPFGINQPHLTTANLNSMHNVWRGVDMFRDMFVVTEWVTNEFADEMQKGAKREIPKIADIHGFRNMMAPILKRRLMEEPEVAAYIHIPPHTETVVDIAWDKEHLAYYYAVAQEFVNWYKQARKETYGVRQLNMIAVLAKIQAVMSAANIPQLGVGDMKPFDGLTSKQRAAIARVTEWVKQGHKTILLCHSPHTVHLLSSKLEKIPHVRFHGEININDRIKALDDDFRQGDKMLLIGTKGTLQTGYNIHQASRVLLYDRSWTPKIERQAIARVLRPQQTQKVEVEYLHLEGSIDSYQAQMVEMKGEAMSAGIDFGDEDPTREFLHIETILGRFVEDFEKRFRVKVDSLPKFKSKTREIANGV